MNGHWFLASSGGLMQKSSFGIGTTEHWFAKGEFIAACGLTSTGKFRDRVFDAKARRARRCPECVRRTA